MLAFWTTIAFCYSTKLTYGCSEIETSWIFADFTHLLEVHTKKYHQKIGVQNVPLLPGTTDTVSVSADISVLVDILV